MAGKENIDADKVCLSCRHRSAAGESLRDLLGRQDLKKMETRNGKKTKEDNF